MNLRIALSVNTAWNVVNFRSGLIKSLLHKGHEVIILAPVDAHVTKIEALGCRFVALEMDNKGTNPLRDAGLLLRYRSILARERPDVFLGFTIKPNVYGSMAANLLGIPVINNVSGLGTAFIRDTWLTKVVRLLYRTALRRSKCVFFQNRDDCTLFIGNNIVRAETARLLPGSGINLAQFNPAPLPTRRREDGAQFLLIARLLYDKGIREYIHAAKLLKNENRHLRFSVLGFLDADNRTAVPKSDVDQWVAEGVIDYLGSANDVRPYIADADCIVLPSYREGTPRTLLEGGAMARPLIASDVPGCREVVDDGVNGFLCKVKDSQDLADKMFCFANMPIESREAMAKASRIKMERQFDEQIVIDSYHSAIRDAVNKN